MNILWKLRGYIKMFSRQYIIAIVALQVVALLSLIPSWLIGRIIDSISANELSITYLLIHIGGIVVSAIAMYGLRYVWQSQLYGKANCMELLLLLRKCCVEIYFESFQCCHRHFILAEVRAI